MIARAPGVERHRLAEHVREPRVRAVIEEPFRRKSPAQERLRRMLLVPEPSLLSDLQPAPAPARGAVQPAPVAQRFEAPARDGGPHERRQLGVAPHDEGERQERARHVERGPAHAVGRGAPCGAHHLEAADVVRLVRQAIRAERHGGQAPEGAAEERLAAAARHELEVLRREHREQLRADVPERRRGLAFHRPSEPRPAVGVPLEVAPRGDREGLLAVVERSARPDRDLAGGWRDLGERGPGLTVGGEPVDRPDRQGRRDEAEQHRDVGAAGDESAQEAHGRAPAPRPERTAASTKGARQAPL